MHLRPEFESLSAQLLHRDSPPTFDDALKVLMAEKTRLRELGTLSSGPPPQCWSPPAYLLPPCDSSHPRLAQLPLVPLELPPLALGGTSARFCANIVIFRVTI